MKRYFTVVLWLFWVIVGALLGVWLEADLNPVVCAKEHKLCSDVRCRKYPDNPFIEECTYQACKYGYAWKALTPSYYSCCDSVITPPRGDPRVPACCNIPYYRIICKTKDGGTCPEEILPQDCSSYRYPGICPVESHPERDRRCLAFP